MQKPLKTPGAYKVVCISLYPRDIERLEALVGEMKRRGLARASKSQVIRLALAEVDVGKLVPLKTERR
jgi:hypothetical protein